MHDPKNSFLTLVFLALSPLTFGQQKGYDSVINQFISYVKENKVKEITKRINYPIQRFYPIPDITSEKDFIKRYLKIFDDSLKQLITNSDVHKDWTYMGWRGIMLQNGILWLDVDGDLESINYQSTFEKKEWKRLVEKDKAKLYPSLKKFNAPILFMETKRFKIRIDDMGNGDYRYASWPINKSQSEKPDLILTNGTVNFDGSGGNHEYIFKNGNYTYHCYISILRPDYIPPANLTIFKKKKKILYEPALKLKGN